MPSATVKVMNLFGEGYLEIADTIESVNDAVDRFYAAQSATRPASIGVQLNHERVDSALDTPVRGGDVVLILEGEDAEKASHSGA